MGRVWWAVGRNFRSIAPDLAGTSAPDEAVLQTWVLAERRAVMAHVAAVLTPRPSVREPLERRDANSPRGAS